MDKKGLKSYFESIAGSQGQSYSSRKPFGELQVLAIEFVAFAIEFVAFAIEFVSLANEFVTLAIEFVHMAIGIRHFGTKFVMTEEASRNQPPFSG